MDNQIQIFRNNQFGEVRVTELNNEPMFAAADVCSILGYSNTSKAINDHTEPEERYNESLERGGNMLFINESGLYSLIIRSNKVEAKPFKKWVTSEVLPSIRKHGGYLTPQTIENALLNPDTLIKLATNLKAEKQRRVEAEKKVALQAPKVLFADAVATSERSCLIGELAKILNQNGIQIGQNRLFEWLRANGYLCTKGEYYNMPSQQSMDMGLFEIKKTVINKPDGSVLVSNTVKVTGKGQIYFVNKFIKAA